MEEEQNNDIIVKIDSITRSFMSPSLCTKWSILIGRGNLNDAVLKGCEAMLWHLISWNK